MLEDSVESFMAHWRQYASPVWVYPRVEGSPLIECAFGGSIVQAFERTNPYACPSGQAKMIVHAITEALELQAGEEKALEVLDVSCLKLMGSVLQVEGAMLVLDAGVPVVLGLLDLPEAMPQAGAFIACETLPPLHAFVLSEPRLSQRGPDSL